MEGSVEWKVSTISSLSSIPDLYFQILSFFYFFFFGISGVNVVLLAFSSGFISESSCVRAQGRALFLFPSIAFGPDWIARFTPHANVLTISFFSLLFSAAILITLLSRYAFTFVHLYCCFCWPSAIDESG